MTDTEIIQRMIELLAQRQPSTGTEPAQLTTKEKWQQAADEWRANPDNITTTDPTGATVVNNFRHDNPHVFIVGRPEVDPDPTNPGHFIVQLSIQLAPFVTPATSTPSPMPQMDATQGADGVGFPGSQPPPGFDSATLSAAKAGDTLVGTDGVIYTKNVKPSMFGGGGPGQAGYEVWWTR